MEIKLTNPRVVNFYLQNSHVSPDSINLTFIDMLESFHPTSHTNEFRPHAIEGEIRELKNFLENNQPQQICREIGTLSDSTISRNMAIISDKIQASCDKILLHITETKSNQDSIKNLILGNQENLSSLLRRMENPYSKGKISEYLLYNILEKLFPSGSINFVGLEKETGDFILEREGKVKILIENKNWRTNVSTKDVDKFIRDVSAQNCCGILFSQSSGISLRKNFEIDVVDGNVLVFVHHVNNDIEKVKLAIEILDNFQQKLASMKTQFVISQENLSKINFEYNTYISQKKEIKKTVRDFASKVTKLIDDVQFPNLELCLMQKVDA